MTKTAPSLSLNDLPPPESNPNLFGHAEAEQALFQAAQSGKLPHGWLFAGPRGIGKATLAYRFARFLLAGGTQQNDEPAGLFGDEPKTENLFIPASHPVFYQVAARGHNDLKIIEKNSDDKKTETINVEDIRAVAPFLRLTAGQEGWRIVMIDGADAMNRNAQNALLKILEEPGGRSLIILISENPGLLLPTIRSRCRVLNLKADPSLLHNMASDLPDDEKEIVDFLADGALGQAHHLLQSDGIKHFRDALELLEKAGDRQVMHKLSDIYAKADQNSWYWLRTSLLRLLQSAVTGRALPSSFQFKTSDPGALIRLHDAATQLFDELERFHLDKKQAILSLAGLVQAARLT